MNQTQPDTNADTHLEYVLCRQKHGEDCWARRQTFFSQSSRILGTALGMPKTTLKTPKYRVRDGILATAHCPRGGYVMLFELPRNERPELSIMGESKHSGSDSYCPETLVERVCQSCRAMLWASRRRAEGTRSPFRAGEGEAGGLSVQSTVLKAADGSSPSNLKAVLNCLMASPTRSATAPTTPPFPRCHSPVA